MPSQNLNVCETLTLCLEIFSGVKSVKRAPGSGSFTSVNVPLPSTWDPCYRPRAADERRAWIRRHCSGCRWWEEHQWWAVSSFPIEWAPRTEPQLEVQDRRALTSRHSGEHVFWCACTFELTSWIRSVNHSDQFHEKYSQKILLMNIPALVNSHLLTQRQWTTT